MRIISGITLIESSRATKLLGYKMLIAYRAAEAGLEEILTYQAHGYDTVCYGRIEYSPNYYLGPFLFGIKKTATTVVVEHISNKKGHNWTMTFKKLG